MKTSSENIYASGDVVSSPMLAHVAAVEGEMVANVVAEQKCDVIDYEVVPNVVYSKIETASLGLTEEDAKKKHENIKVEKQFFKSNGRSVAKRSGEGFVKIIISGKTKKIIGVHMVGENVSELIHEFAVAKKNDLTIDAIEHTIHAHPTLSEIAVELIKSISGRSLTS